MKKRPAREQIIEIHRTTIDRVGVLHFDSTEWKWIIGCEIIYELRADNWVGFREDLPSHTRSIFGIPVEISYNCRDVITLRKKFETRHITSRGFINNRFDIWGKYIDTDIASMYPTSIFKITESSKSYLDGFKTKGFIIDDEMTRYCKFDVEAIQKMFNKEIMKKEISGMYNRERKCPEIKDVIFNNPATIVFWKDGTKTVVKAQEGDTFDPEKGLTMAITKKLFGNKGNYFNHIKKWLPKEEVKVEETVDPIKDIESAGEEYEEIELPELKAAAGKTKCKGDCMHCCPVITRNYRKAGNGCKNDCDLYNTMRES